MSSPIAFISYAWENEALKGWVKDLALQLRQDGVEALLDQWETAPGDQLTRYMEEGISRADFVLIICTPAYRKRSSRPSGGVSYEGSVMNAEVVTGRSRRKFIPLLRGHDWMQSAPPWLLGSFYIDFRGEPYSRNSYQELLDTLLYWRERPPAVGSVTREVRPPRSMDLPKITSKTDLHSAHDESWPYVWKQLRDLKPHDTELIEMGRSWLLANSSTNAWPFVWQDLVQTEPPSDELIDLGRRWLYSNIGHSAWAFVWRRLSELKSHSDELIELGKKHLRHGR
ncbi:MAG: toll/interleukin-1 receptor domain-containing protein [Deltaproteobacteria bacterium]|nr:toll/interleukin-1 receptor domain-containing protein [Deltaproteobacteria bacterium]